MPVFNGMNVNPFAHGKLLEAQSAVGGLSQLPERFNITSCGAKTLLRAVYTATGGKRGSAPDAYEPSNDELRLLYNGKWADAGAGLYREATGGQKAPEAKSEAPRGKEIPLVEETQTDAQKLAAMLASAMGGQKVNPEAVKAIAVEAVNGRVGEVLSSLSALVAEEVAKSVRTVEVKIAEAPGKKIQTAHKCFDRVVRYAANRKNILLVGPAGSGKTTLAEQIADALGLPFYMSGKVADETKLIGFIDAGGTYRGSAFRQAYEHGGVFLFDEMDGSAPDALVAFNAPLAGQWGDFPDGMIRRHPDFVAIAAANTYGRGADRQYVGREQLDAATLDRFAVIEVDYDEDLERAISSDKNWTLYVQKVRAAVAKEKVRHIVSPRASIEGGIMLAAGEPRADVEEAYIWKGMEEVARNRVLAAMR